MSEIRNEIKQKKSRDNFSNVSQAVLAATISALASTVQAGHQLEINIPENADEIDFSRIHSADFMNTLKSNHDIDYSVFKDGLVSAETGEKIELSESVLLACLDMNKVDRGMTWPEGGADCPTKNLIDCYDNCHSNCHGSRSWR